MPRTLEERLAGADPEVWQAEEAGDSIFGEVEEIGLRDGDYGEYHVVTLLNDDGVFSVAVWGTVLINKFKELDPQVGDLVGFKYLGEKAPKKAGGKPYKNWRLVIQRAPALATVAAAPAATGAEFTSDDPADAE